MTGDDAISAANALLREKGYAERDLLVHPAPRGKALLKGNKILSPLSDEAVLVLRVVQGARAAELRARRRTLRPADLRARLAP